MSKVQVRKYGIIHGLAYCNDCKWSDGLEMANGMQHLRNKIYSHIRKTGHTVTLETGNSTDYKRV